MSNVGNFSAPSWAWSLSLDPGARWVLLGLWSFADWTANGPTTVGPARATLAARIGVSPATVRRGLAKLREAGWIRDEPGGRWGPLGIRLAWAQPLNLERSEPEPPLNLERSTLSGDRSTMNTDRSTLSAQPCAVDRSTLHVDRSTLSAGPLNLATQTLQGPFMTLQDREPDAPLPRASRHLEIQAEQAALRVPTSEIVVDESRHVTPEIFAAVRSIPAAHGRGWFTDLDRPTWARALGLAVGALALTPEQVVAVLEAWDAQWGRLDQQQRLAVESKRPDAPMPARIALWDARHRTWLAAALRGPSLPRHPVRRAPVVEREPEREFSREEIAAVEAQMESIFAGLS